MTHLSASDVHSPYGGYWVPPKLAAEKGLSSEPLPSTEDEIFRDKTTKGIFWLVSNCKTPYILVDIAGSCAKNETMKNVCPKGNTCEEHFRKYYFFISAENSICTDYITEKYWSRYHLPLIPIVMRRDVYQRRVPPMSYIAMDDFPNAKALADHLNTLMSNRSEYMKYFAWRGQGWSRARWNAPGYRIGLCRLCEKLLEPTAEHPTAPIADIARWYTEQSNCESDDFAKSWAS
ncbi:alpha1,3-fucosyltransferase [Aphelenchoides avenae]|nr:alpha1,3-fucosyltransferase [Aphelenchus avenae]